MMITSSTNAKYRRWMSLCDSQGQSAHHQALVAGRKIVDEILSQPISPTNFQTELQTASVVQEVLIPEKFDISKIKNWGPVAQSFRGKVFQLSKNLFDEIDIFGTRWPILVLSTPVLKPVQYSMNSKVQVWSPLSEPSNLGALQRSCLAFGVDEIVLLEESANPFLPKVNRAACGANFKISMSRGPALDELANISEISSWIVLDAEGLELSKHIWSKSPKILVGQEGPGLPKSILDRAQRVRIPMARDCESLNATVALSCALFHYRLQHPLSD